MTYFNFKAALIAIFAATSSFASSVPHEEGECDSSALARAPMSAGNLDALTSDVIGHVTSLMPIHTLEEAQDLVTVCKFFHAHVVPYMRLSWTPKEGSIPVGGKFAQSYASRIMMLDLSLTSTFQNTHLQGFENLTILVLGSNKTITDERLQSLTKLADLDLDLNETITDAALQNLTNLTHLDLGFNETITDEAVKKLPKLTSLMLIGNNIITPKGYVHLPNLEIFR